MRRKIYIRSLLIVFVLIVGSTFYYLPYYVTKPGMAKELEPIVSVEGGDKAEGSFMLTTIRMGKANIYSYAIAKFSDYQELFAEKDIRRENESDEEYNLRQLHMMDGSKNHAIQVAFEKAGKSITFDYHGVYVLGVIEGMPAEKTLKTGDQIIKVDHLKFQSSQEFIDYVAEKKVDDEINIVYIRNNKEYTAKMKLKAFDEHSEKVGIGISLEDDKSPVTNPPIKIDSEEIGGPSAGLMFTLEIYNQLTKGDLTKGYRIAGTGTMSEDGIVGPIGGIQQKIVAAHKSGAEIFFAPNERGKKDSNYREALIAAKDIKTKMKIVPVDTFDDARTYLEKLPFKN
ncbi:SepM family pheromone-processing serine protease [Peribacillus huizhouensis]|uniref:endopeptidase La n=1 Tax=Peribacillus huizhouensis TaxID=1501239 RepID=A0ABR6CJU7_9BACI|nr:SepM family pheromone-processing serine protease [Peribacillus huizhouensis]MBA9024981.1 PDZ domain-containing protein [Peribacillus huizhouensis]